jgi:hypothetical protein
MALGKCAEGSMRRALKLAASVVRCRGSSEVSSTTLPTVRRSSIARWASPAWFIGNRWPTSTFSLPLSTEPLSERVASPSNARCAPSE